MKNWSQNTIFFTGLLLYLIINLFQAAFTEIHYDEAYYWVYAQFPAFGYFDHPPMIAGLIWIGTKLLPGVLGVRIVGTILATCGFLFIWDLVRKEKANAILFWLMVFSIALFVPYTFFAVPDIPLFFFTSFFFWIYRKYLSNDTVSNTALLGFAMAAMIYSKYHAVLLLFFVFLSNVRLLKKKSAWIAVGIGVGLLIPHFYWQIVNDFPSFRYHLVDSHKTAYKFEVTLNYLVSLLALTGPLLGWLYLYAAGKEQGKDPFSRGLKFSFYGILIFFFLVTFGGDIEAHWTLVAYIPMLILAYRYLSEQARWHKTIQRLGVATFLLVMVVRVVVMTGADMMEEYRFWRRMFGWEKDMKLLQQEARGLPVVMQDTYQEAARYAYYANQPYTTYGMCGGLYRHNQYDIYPLEEWLQGERVLYVSLDSSHFESDYRVLETQRKKWYMKEIDNFRSYNMLEFLNDSSVISVQQGVVSVDRLFMRNPYNRTVWLEENPEFKARLKCYVKVKRRWKEVDRLEVGNIQIEPGDVAMLNNIQFAVPDTLTPGTYECVIGLASGSFRPVHGHLRFDLTVD